MGPDHLHFKKKGQCKPRIELRFWFISLLLDGITQVKLKIR